MCKICKKCGIEFDALNNRKRRICSDCEKQEARENYKFKTEIYNAKRREKRRSLQSAKNCVICSKLFYTARSLQLTCSKECQHQHQKNLSLIWVRKKLKALNVY